MYLARELTEHSLPEIGRGIGDRNHSTVVHAVNRIGAALRTDPAVRSAVDNLHRRLGRPSITADVDCDNPQPAFLLASRIRPPIDVSTGPTNSRSGK